MDKKAIDIILKGGDPSTYKTTQIGYDKKVNTKTREVGEVWYETNAVTGTVTRWEQKQGYKVKSPANLEGLLESTKSFKFWNCPKESCTCTTPNRLDYRFQKKFGMCSDCQLSKETMMKINGEYAEYEKKRMQDNVLGWLKDAEADKELLKQSIEKDYDQICENGVVVSWEFKGKEDYLKKIDEEWEIFKNGLLKEYEIE